MGQPIHAHVLPDDGKPPEEWTLAEWQGVLEELGYQAESDPYGMGEQFKLAHDALRWLVDYFLARRMNA